MVCGVQLSGTRTPHESFVVHQHKVTTVKVVRLELPRDQSKGVILYPVDSAKARIRLASECNKAVGKYETRQDRGGKCTRAARCSKRQGPNQRVSEHRDRDTV